VSLTDGAAGRLAAVQAARDRWGPLLETAFRVQALGMYVFLYLPIVVVVIFSYNSSRFVTEWEGFSLRWYEEAWIRDSLVQRALWNSVSIGIVNAVLATLFGTLAALGMQRLPRRVRLAFEAVTYVSIIIPEIVIALATLIFFRTGFDAINPVLAGAFPAGDGERPPQLGLGNHTIIAAHMLFNISLVLLLVRARLAGMDRTLQEASADLFASPWRTFRQVTLPQLMPAILAGFLLSFTFSFDDYIISSFLSGVGSTTLPLFVFGEVRRGVTPRINAVAVGMLVVTLTILFVAQWLLQRRAQGTAGIAGVPVGGADVGDRAHRG
jgi:spermidine/putrescine transport system permease protein